MTESRIRETLVSIGAISQDRVVPFAARTRDNETAVFRDTKSGVIFIDDFYVGEAEYEAGDYRGVDAPSLEDRSDTGRRVQAFSHLYQGRAILDFGCGAGGFLRNVRHLCEKSFGLELQRSYRDALNSDGIPCFTDISDCPLGLDACFMFHVLEHLPDPLQVLSRIRDHLDPDTGTLVVEVPHARDFLISTLRSEAFIAFTLWSQHLVLHTRDSLRLLLEAAGFTDVQIYGVQRYGLANHLTWLSKEKPGGHRGPLALLETEDLRESYALSLSRMDANDTLLATARVAP